MKKILPYIIIDIINFIEFEIFNEDLENNEILYNQYGYFEKDITKKTFLIFQTNTYKIRFFTYFHSTTPQTGFLYCKIIKKLVITNYNIFIRNILHYFINLHYLKIKTCDGRSYQTDLFQGKELIKLTKLKKICIGFGKEINDNKLKYIKNITILKLNGCKIMKNFSSLRNLRVLILNTNYNTSEETNNKKEQQIQIYKLTNLKKLTISNFYDLKGENLYFLKYLKNINIHNCPNFNFDILQKLKYLRVLTIKSIETNIKSELPNSIKKIIMCWCPKITGDNFLNLHNLMYLELSDCESFKEKNLLSLKKLVTLILDGTFVDTQLNILKYFKNLQYLNICLFENFTGDSLLHVKKTLVCLKINGCDQLKKIINLEKLEILNILNCNNFSTFSGLHSLKFLKIECCSNFDYNALKHVLSNIKKGCLQIL
jgi:hypothetical protein